MDILYRIMHLIQLVDTSQSPFLIFSGGSGGHGGAHYLEEEGLLSRYGSYHQHEEEQTIRAVP